MIIHTLRQSTATTSPAGLFVDNEGTPGLGESLALYDPSSGEQFAEMAGADAADVDRAVRAARAAAPGWFDSAPVERGRLCAAIARLLLERVDELAEISVHDAGLPVGLARRDVETAARYFEFYAGVPDKLTGESIPVGPAAIDVTVREPWGVCAIVLPFNFPMQLAARDLAAALCTANTIVLKLPEQAPLPSFALATLCAEAGAPPGVVNAISGTGAEAGDPLVRHPGVDHVTFTGSAATATRVLAAAAEGIKPTTIELGGKSPHLIFADADIDRAVAAIVATTFRSAGQACSAGTRLLVESTVHDKVVDRLARAVSDLRVGAASTDPDVGPVISSEQRDRVLAAVATGVSEGAIVVTGGGPPDEGTVPRDGYFVAPTILDSVDRASPVAREEIFGPVMSITSFASESDAVDIANDTDYGLVAGVWTSDVSRAHRVARTIQAGQIFVNSYGVGGGVELPFGGYKRSGFGRVKGLAGALEYTQLKNICVAFD